MPSMSSKNGQIGSESPSGDPAELGRSQSGNGQASITSLNLQQIEELQAWTILNHEEDQRRCLCSGAPR
jgi:hypothetical protein